MWSDALLNSLVLVVSIAEPGLLFWKALDIAQETNKRCCQPIFLAFQEPDQDFLCLSMASMSEWITPAHPCVHAAADFHIVVQRGFDVDPSQLGQQLHDGVDSACVDA